MTTTRKLRLAAVASLAAVGVSAAPAQAFEPMGSISNGAPRPVVKWDHAAWKHCWITTYAQWREDGSSPSVSGTAADLTCGTQP